MKFKARILQSNLAVLTGAVNILDRVGHNAVVHLSEAAVRFSVLNENVDGVHVYSELIQDQLFSDYRIESQSNNCILFQISLDHLLRALGSGKTAPMCQLKLVKRDGRPCLAVEARALEVDVVHDIPITVMRASEIQQYMPPDVPTPQIQLELPRTKALRTVVERMNRMDKYMFLDASMEGTLVLRVQTEEVTVKTFYTNLVPRFDGLDEEDAIHNRASVKLDIRKFVSVLNCYNIPHDSIICCIIERVAVVVHVQLSPLGVGSLTYYLPVLMTGMDDLLAEYSEEEEGERDEENEARADDYGDGSSDAP